MKKRINITIDYELYEESKKYIDNMSAYICACLKRGIAYNKRNNNFSKKVKENIERNKKAFEDISIKDLMKDLEEL